MEKALREEISAYGRLVYAQGLTSGTSGNLSARLDANHILVTASGCHKGMLAEKDVLLYDLQSGKVISKTPCSPSSEIRMHACVYQHRPEIGAVIHAHPPYLVALSVANLSLQEVVLPEAVLALGAVVDCGYATPTTEDVIQAMKPYVQEGHTSFALARHGSVTIGKDMNEAFCRLETLEHVAKVTAIASAIDHVTFLPQQEVEKLKKIFGKN